MIGATRRPFNRVAADGTRGPIDRDVAVEMPVALEFDGIGYAVLMATPADLEDLAYGFALSERLIESEAEIVDVAAHPVRDGIILRIALAPHRAGRIAERVRHRASDSSCGLCGIENLEQAMRLLPKLAAPCKADDTAVFAALEALSPFQLLNARTHAVHAAACCSAGGAIRLVREDVGRHNAFDKLIGAMLRAGLAWDAGFALLSSRCSYELVEKAVLSGCPLLATISAPTALALDRAAAAGLQLRVLTRTDALLTPCDPDADVEIGFGGHFARSATTGRS